MFYNILVIDDDRKTASYMADMLRLIGHVVTVALGPRAAFYSLKQVIPDMVFLDINMPGVDGFEVCRYLRRDPATANIPIVIVSANSEQGYKDAAKAAGANGYLVKPVMIEDLTGALDRVLKTTQTAP